MDPRKILLIIFDGLGDRPIPELGHKTPLEAAPKSALDWFASNGVNGLLDPIAPGVRPGSDTSHLALFGYDPFEVYTGRGPFEAAGVGIDIEPGDIAFRCNFVTVDEGMKVLDRRAGRIREGTEELAKALDGMKLGRVKAIFRAGTEHRAALVLRGKGMCRAVGMDVLEVPGATGGLDTNMVAKGEAALNALRTYDLVFVNVKAADVCGHDGKASEKIKVIERIDQMMAQLKAKLPSDVIVAITADHSTPCAVQDHSGDPVPLTIFGDGVRVDGVPSYDERSVAKGGLGRIRGRDLLPILLSLANRAEKYGS